MSSLKGFYRSSRLCVVTGPADPTGTDAGNPVISRNARVLKAWRDAGSAGTSKIAESSPSSVPFMGIHPGKIFKRSINTVCNAGRGTGADSMPGSDVPTGSRYLN